MKIAIVHRYYPMAGGVTTVVRYLKEALEKENQLILITNDLLCKEKNTVYINGKDFSFYWRAFKYIRKEKFDVVHTQSFPFCYFSPLLKIPVILTVQGYDKIYDWPKNILTKMKVIFATVGRGLSYRFADKIIAISNVVKKNIIQRWGINENKIEIIHNGVDSNFFSPSRVKRNEKEFRVFIYSTTKRKGFDKLLEWMPLLIKEIPNIKIVVAGSKTKVDNKFTNYFEFLGLISFNKMPRVFNSVDLVLLPSIDEPFGITAAEGMACGKPVIVSKVSGISDVINGENGIASNFENFAKNIILFAKNKELGEKTGRLAIKTAKNQLSANYLSKQHVKLYKDIISSK